MTTFAPPAVESDIRDQPAPAPAALPGETTGQTEAHANGLAVQANNAIPEFQPPSTQTAETTGGDKVDATLPPNGPTSEIASEIPSKIVNHTLSTETPPVSSNTPALDAVPTDGSATVADATATMSLDSQVSNPVVPQDDAAVSQMSVDQPSTENANVQSVPGAATTISAPSADAMDVEPTPVLQSEPAKVEPAVEEDGQIKADADIAVQAKDSEISQVENKDQAMMDAPPKVSREREEDDGETGHLAKRVRTDEVMPDAPEGTAISNEAPVPLSTAAPETTSAIEPQPVSAPAAPVAQDTSTLADTSSSTPQVSDAPAPVIPAVEAAVTQNVTPPQPTPPTDSSPMDEKQKKKLIDGLRNLKKNKNAFNFLKPVDYVALNLPNYPNVVKNPTDLSTIENKLKDGKYESVDAYSADWDLMINNAVAFNGQNHLVAQQGMILRSQLWAQLRKLPKAGEITAPAPNKKQQASLAAGIRDTPRRAPAAPAAATTPVGETFAAPNGIPTIRRGSSVGGRPKREIHKPTRDLAYQSAKPIKKKHKAEIDFAKHVVDETTRPRFETLMAPFYKPVDPVALAIPHYFAMIKKPMSLSVVKDKLQTNQYETVKEVEADIKLIWANCYKFNGKDHAVSKMASEYEKIFDGEFAKKDAWIAANAPQSVPHSPADEYDSSDEEDEEDDVDPEAAQIAMLHRQMQELQEKTMALLEQRAKKGSSKKKGASKGAGGAGGAAGKKRKSGSLGGVKAEKKPKVKAKAKERPVTAAEKQEISSKIGDLNAEQITKAAELIKDSLRRIGRNDLADKAEDDMEFDIDQIPNDALHQLLKLVRKASAPTAVEETHYSKSSSYAPSRPKKNKPMSKSEQEDHIRRLQGQLANFENGVAVGSPTGGDESSDDDEDESGSESEEE